MLTCCYSFNYKSYYYYYYLFYRFEKKFISDLKMQELKTTYTEL